MSSKRHTNRQERHPCVTRDGLVWVAAASRIAAMAAQPARMDPIGPSRTIRSHIAFIAILAGVLLFAGSLYVADRMVDDRVELLSLVWLTILILSPVLLTGLMCRWRSLPVARSHPWEVFLLLALPAWTAWLSQLADFIAGWVRVPPHWLVVFNLSVVTTAVPLVLAATYPRVRRYGHDLLKLLWEVHIIASIGALAFSLAPTLLGHGQTTFTGLILGGVTILTLPFGSDYWDAFYQLSLNGVFWLVVVVWFMRRAAARTSRPHAFLLLALAGASLSFNYQWVLSQFSPSDSGLDLTVALWGFATGVGMNVLLLWALIRYRVDTPPVRLIAALLVLPILGGLVPLGVRLIEWWSSWGWPSHIAVWMLRGVLQPLPVLVLGYWFTRPRARSGDTHGPG